MTFEYQVIYYFLKYKLLILKIIFIINKNYKLIFKLVFKINYQDFNY